MRQYRMCNQKTEMIEKIICNKCKKEIDIMNGIPRGEALSVEKRWGYFSGKDNETHRFDLCETCYDELVSTFEIPVERE